MRLLALLLFLWPLGLLAQNTLEEDDLYATWLDRPAEFLRGEVSLSAFETYKQRVYERGNTTDPAPTLPKLNEDPESVEALRETWGEDAGTTGQGQYQTYYDPYAPNNSGNWNYNTGFMTGPYGSSSYMGVGYQWGNPGYNNYYNGYPNYYAPYYPSSYYGGYNGGYYGPPRNPTSFESNQPRNNNPRPRGGGSNTIALPPAQSKPNKPIRIESPSYSSPSPSSSPSRSPSSSPSSTPRNKPNRF